MKALVLNEVHQAPVLEARALPEPKAGEVRIKIKAAALNHRDVYITQGLYPGIQLPCVLGSDASGVVDALGEGCAAHWQDAEVVVNPNIQWGDAERHQSTEYHILGMPSDGTFQEYICVPQDRLAPKPTHLSFEEAAALPLAGMTAYRALFGRAQAVAGERVLISGVGGGVALFACQFALAAGCEVYVTSGSASKIEKAIALGARGGVNYKEEDWHKQLRAQAGGFDVIIDSAGGEGFAKLVDLTRMGGRVAFYGGTRGKFTLSPQRMFWKQVSILASTMASDEEFQAMIHFVATHKLVPQCAQRFSITEAAAAFAYMDEGKQFGKIILTF